MKFVTAYNPTDGPVIIDGQGRTLGGHERTAVDQADESVKDAIDAGRLILTGDPPKGAVQDAVDAASAAKSLNARHDALSKLDAEVLAPLAADAGLVSDDEDSPTKTDLVALLVRTDVEIPTYPKPKE